MKCGSLINASCFSVLSALFVLITELVLDSGGPFGFLLLIFQFNIFLFQEGVHETPNGFYDFSSPRKLKKVRKSILLD